MAARTTRIFNDENTRKKIQATQLLKRLTDHILADEDIMSTSQVNAALGLLKKTLPDLKQQEINVTATEMTYEEWLEHVESK